MLEPYVAFPENGTLCTWEVYTAWGNTGLPYIWMCKDIQD